MEIKFYDELAIDEAYNAIVWETSIINYKNTLVLDKHYSTKTEAVEAVKTFKANYKDNGKLECFVRYRNYQNGTKQDYNL